MCIRDRLEVDGYRVNNDGTVELPRPLRNRINFAYLVNQKFIGDTVNLTVSRNGETYRFNITLTKCHRETKKVGLKEFDKAGEYFVNSYLAFVPLTQNFLEDAIGELGSLLKSDRPKHREGDQHLMLSHVFPHRDTYEYDGFANTCLLYTSRCV